MKGKGVIVAVACMFLIAPPALAEEADPQAYLDEGAPETSPHFHHYVYDVSCLPDRNIYKIVPSGGAYQPKEWRNEAHDKLHQAGRQFGIILNNKIVQDDQFLHSCVLRNGSVIQTEINYSGKTAYGPGNFLSFSAKVSITTAGGGVYFYSALFGGNRDPWGMNTTLSVHDNALKELSIQRRFGKRFEDSKEILLSNQ